MSTESPQVGETSADGQFRWDGREWAPLARGQREPTSWTQPLQLGSAVYLVIAALVLLVTNALYVTEPALERTMRITSPGLSDDQIQASASLGFTLGWVLVAVLAIGGAVLAYGSYRGWRWVFWADMVALAIGALQAISNGLALTSPSTQTLPQPAIVIDLVLSLIALALLVWFVVAAVRYGPWAMRRP
jgi:hypothetical protein